ncbi:MAG: acyl-CoA reductase [Chitinophagaceae bacterium]|nr:acyl-CoA reductase [Chitinophagaceae bacterium]
MISNRIELLLKLRDYLLSDDEELALKKELTERENGWFTQHFINFSIKQITEQFLDPVKLKDFSGRFDTAECKAYQKSIGIIMAGNIPLVGFHDFLCVFLSGFNIRIKLSGKDNIMLPHLLDKLFEWDPSLKATISFEDMLKGCDAYIATGGNNSARYFEYYFAKFPHIIRKNRTSVALLDGTETTDELSLLADDVYTYFGLGCRNVTKLYVPENYDFIPLLAAFKKYDELKHHNKYRNNFDYQLALYILNNQYYMSNESLLFIENASVFSAVSVLHYETYSDLKNTLDPLKNNESIQAIVGHGHIPFGQSQSPALHDFADGVDTVAFLNSL